MTLDHLAQACAQARRIRRRRTPRRNPLHGSMDADEYPSLSCPSRPIWPPPAAASRPGCRCGSCARPAARCPSTGRCAPSTRMLEACFDAELVCRDHAAAGAPARRGRRHPVLRHRRAAARVGHRPGHRARRRAGDRPPDPHRRRRRGDETARARAGRAGRRCGVAAGRRAGRRAADRVRRRAVHAGVLPGRGRAEPQPRAHQGDDARRARHLARADDRADRRHHRVPAGPAGRRRRRDPAVRLLGGHAVAGRLPQPTCCRTARGCSRRWPARACR